MQITADQLIDIKSDRAAFDATLARCNAVRFNELIVTTKAFLGHLIVAKTKGDLIAAMKRRQRQDELNGDRALAQSKLRP